MKQAGICILLAIAMIVPGCTKSAEDYATVTFLIGDVKKNNVDIEIGEVIKEKDSLVTGAQSSCDVRIGESIIRIKENSKVLISQLMRSGNLENTGLGLEVGKVLCKPRKLMKSESFLVKTPTAVAGVRGTKFTVEADQQKTTRIKVFDGEVKVIKRVASLEDSVEQLLQEAPAVEEKEKVVVTEKDVKLAEQRVEQAFSKEGRGSEVALVKVIEQVKDDVVVARREVQTFKVEDFKDERAEIIAIEPKPMDIVRQIEKAVEMEKERPKPDGRLLVTRYEIYFIKSGKILWEGKLITPPLRKDDKIYIASGDYVFSATLDGPVIWRKNIENDGRLEVKGEKLVVHSKQGIRELDLGTGQE